MRRDLGPLHPKVPAKSETPKAVPVTRVEREGRDLTVVTCGNMLSLARSAAESLAKEELEIEILDLRSLDEAGLSFLRSSVQKTHKAFVLAGPRWEDWKAAEVMAVLVESVFESLDGPVLRFPAANEVANGDLDRLVNELRRLAGY